METTFEWMNYSEKKFKENKELFYRISLHLFSQNTFWFVLFVLCELLFFYFLIFLVIFTGKLYLILHFLANMVHMFSFSHRTINFFFVCESNTKVNTYTLACIHFWRWMSWYIPRIVIFSFIHSFIQPCASSTKYYLLSSHKQHVKNGCSDKNGQICCRFCRYWIPYGPYIICITILACNWWKINRSKVFEFGWVQNR